MKPLRRKKTCEVTHDPITGQERILELTQEEDFLSDHGSVDSASLHQRYFRDCGCDGPIGGRCFECGAISCKSCHRRCHNCQKPICLALKQASLFSLQYNEIDDFAWTQLSCSSRLAG